MGDVKASAYAATWELREEATVGLVQKVAPSRGELLRPEGISREFTRKFPGQYRKSDWYSHDLKLYKIYVRFF
jgi:hypothetical protein